MTILNSCGKPVHPTEVGEHNFAQWFGASRAIDDAGRPLVLYHGTNRSFDAFNTRVIWSSREPRLASDYAEYKAMEPGWGPKRDVGHASVMPLYVRAEFPFCTDSQGADTVPAFFARAIEQARTQGRAFSEADVLEKIQFIRQCGRREESGPHYSTHDFWNGSSFFGADGDAAIYELLDMLGFDSIVYTEDGVRTFGVLDPTAVKSAIGNSGLFDRHSADATDAHGRGPLQQNVAARAAIGAYHATPALCNDKGRPVHHTVQGQHNFREWFDNSGLVDGEGRPIVAYHGTTRDFTSFDSARLGEKTGALDARSAFFFAANPDSADQFTWENGDKCGHIMPVYLKARRPLFSDHLLSGATGTAAGRIIEGAKADGYDCVVFTNTDMLGHTGVVYAMFDPIQIKSALGNNGRFDPHSSNLTDTSSDMALAPVEALPSQRPRYRFG